MPHAEEPALLDAGLLGVLADRLGRGEVQANRPAVVALLVQANGRLFAVVTDVATL